MDYIKMLEAQQLKDNIPQFHVGVLVLKEHSYYTLQELTKSFL